MEFEVLKNFLKEIQTKIPVIAITTDSKPYYRNITNKLHVKHQLCIFHFKKEINTWIKKLKRKNKTNQEELNKIHHYKKHIFEIIDSKNYKTSKKLFNKLKQEINNIPQVFRKIITKKFLIHFERYVNYLKHQNISKTTNKKYLLDLGILESLKKMSIIVKKSEKISLTVQKR